MELRGAGHALVPLHCLSGCQKGKLGKRRSRLMTAKRAKKRGMSVTLPEVGIFYVIGDKLFLESTQLSRAGHYGDHLVHERSHYEYWAQLVKMGAVPRARCEDFPRGRVAYVNETGKFFLLVGACI